MATNMILIHIQLLDDIGILLFLEVKYIISILYIYIYNMATPVYRWWFQCYSRTHDPKRAGSGRLKQPRLVPSFTRKASLFCLACAIIRECERQTN